MKILLTFFSVLIVLLPVSCSKKTDSTANKNPNTVEVTDRAIFETSMGNIEIELYGKEMPVTVNNFKKYVGASFYDGLIFHRVISGFVIQGGGFDENMTEKKTFSPIKLEISTKLKNKKYFLSMARKPMPDSASSQFFICLGDIPHLDYNPAKKSPNGYAVFGKVTKGMDIVDKIATIPTTTKGRYENVPKSPIIIKKAYMISNNIKEEK